MPLCSPRASHGEHEACNCYDWFMPFPQTQTETETSDSAGIAPAEPGAHAFNADEAVMDAPLLKAQEAAPADYYQNNFAEVFAYVLTAYQEILPEDLEHSLGAYLQADDDAQRLFARLLTRNGPIFLEPSLRYAEVSNSHHALANLEALGLIRRNAAVPADWLLRVLKKSELLDLLDAAGRCHRSWAKERISHHILGVYSDQRIRQIASGHVAWFSLTAPWHWRLVQLLYFGQSDKDWSTQIRRDLGQVRYETVELSQARFTSPQSLQTYLRERELRSYIFRLDEHPLLLPGLVDELSEPMADIEARRLRQRNLLRLGKWCEQHEALGEALRLYAKAEIPPARERRVRIHAKLGNSESCEHLLKQINQSPLSATEKIFSERFGQRRKGYQPPTTIWSVESDCDFDDTSVENFVLEALLEQHGGWGIHSENAVLKTLTGLVYWDAIFSAVPGAFTNPFQSAPHDLLAHEFASARIEELAIIEARVDDDRALVERMTDTANLKWGTANPLVSWGLLQSVPLNHWLEVVPLTWVRQLSAFLIRNLGDYRKGFPDLFLCYEDGTAEFVEVKGPTDQLQPQQRAWFAILRDMGIDARIVKLKAAK